MTEIALSPLKTRNSLIDEENLKRKRQCKRNSWKVIQSAMNSSPISYSISQCLSSLDKECSNRTVADIITIKTFLETSELANKFHSDNLPEESLQKILVRCSTEMKYLFQPKGKILFRIGDEGENFYIIIRGKIGILKPVQYDESLSGFEYYNHLMTLYESNEMYIVKQTIETNRHLIHVELNDLPQLNKIVLSLLLYDFYMNDKVIPAELMKIIASCRIDLGKEQLDIDKDSLDDIAYFVSVKKMLSTYIGDIPQSTADRYRGFKHKNLKSKYSLFKYQSFLELETGAFFGDLALDKKTTRNATIKTCEDTHFCYLDIKSYNSFLLAEKQRLTLNEVAFLVNSFFFKAISFYVFEKKSLNFFIYQELYKGDVLCREGKAIDYVYFIKEGQVELTMKKSVFEIHSLMQYLNELGQHSQEEEKMPLCKNDFANLKVHLKKPIEHSLFITNGKECIGQESVFYGLNYLYTATVITKRCKIYKIDIKSLLKIFQTETMSYNWFALNCKNKVKVLAQRLSSIKESQINYIDYTTHTENKESLFSLAKTSNSVSSEKTKRLLKCRIKLIDPLPLLTTPVKSQTLTSDTINAKELKTERKQTKRISPTVIGQREDITSTPISKAKRSTANPLSLATNDNSHCSLVIERRILSKVQRELGNDPLITNKNFIAIANRRKLQQREESQRSKDTPSRHVFPKSRRHRKKESSVSQSRNFLITQQQYNTIEDKTVNTVDDNEITLTKINSQLFNRRKSKDAVNVSASKMYSGKYFAEKRLVYQQYKKKAVNEYKHVD